SDVADGMNADRDLVRSRQEHPMSYDLVRFPFDGFLADFNLQRGVKHQPQPSTSLITPFPGPGEGKVISNEMRGESRAESPEDLATLAQAAGLSTAVLAALNFEAHPAVVIPYTGYPEHVANQSALIRLLAPE